MNRLAIGSLALLALTVGLNAQDITGTWQGTLQIPAGPRGPGAELRTVIKIVKADTGLRATFYSIDQGAGAIAGSVTQQGSTVKVSTPGIGGTYEGKLDADGVNLVGTWTQGGRPLPMNLKHVKDDAAWEIPKAPPPMKAMAPDAKPVFEVATIKPSRPDAQGRLLRMPNREFSTINTSLSSLLVWAYGVHARQIVGAPAWVESEKYDLAGKPDAEGQPSVQQWKEMVQKLLADRFQLKLHNDKRELTVFALVVAKGGPKLVENQGDPNTGRALLFRGPGYLPARNATMTAFAGVMQSAVLDRPVVDQTGLTGRYDFELKWTPDETQFASLGGYRPPPTEAPDAPPDLFTAIQQQIGLKLETKKLPVDVLVIDHVEKPSEN